MGSPGRHSGFHGRLYAGNPEGAAVPCRGYMHACFSADMCTKISRQITGAFTPSAPTAPSLTGRKAPSPCAMKVFGQDGCQPSCQQVSYLCCCLHCHTLADVVSRMLTTLGTPCFRNFGNPIRGVAVKYLPWLQIARDYRLRHSRLYAQWGSVCDAMTNQPPPADDDLSIAAALRRVQSATTGVPWGLASAIHQSC